MIPVRFLRLMFSREWIFSTLLVLIAVAICYRLGIWQLDRLAGRREFNTHIISMRELPPLDINVGDVTDLTTQEYRRVSATGTYDFANQIAIRNQYYNSEYGYHLVTPLHLDSGTSILVDRGWIPADGNDAPAGWVRYDEPGPSNVDAVLRRGLEGPTIGGPSDPTLMPSQARLEFWTFVDLERLAAQLPYPILDVYIQLASSPADDEPPIPVQPEIVLSEGPHQGYAGQWFTFAGLLLFGYPFYLRKQMK